MLKITLRAHLFLLLALPASMQWLTASQLSHNQVSKKTNSKTFKLMINIEGQKDFMLDEDVCIHTQVFTVKLLLQKSKKLQGKDIFGKSLFSEKFLLADDNKNLGHYDVSPKSNKLYLEEKKLTQYSYVLDSKNLLDNTNLAPLYKVKSYHVSCKSDKLKTMSPKENYGGIVLYAYNGKTDWYLNDIHCKTGYIVIKKTKNIKHLMKSSQGQIHGAVFDSVFKDNSLLGSLVSLVWPPTDMALTVGSGFAYYKGKWEYNSCVFNLKKDHFHKSEKKKDRIMGETEKQWVATAITNWVVNKQQNTLLPEPLYVCSSDPNLVSKRCCISCPGTSIKL